MRIQGLIFVAIIAGLGLILSFVSPDRWLQENIEYQASVLNEAKVEFDDFDFDLFGLKMSWSRLQVTDPNNTMTNTFETGETEFDLLFWPVMWERVLIEDIKLTGFRLGTERETDGYFEMPVNETGEEEPGFIAEVTKQITSEIKQNAQMQISDIKDDINVDSLMALVDIESVDKMNGLQNNLQQKYSRWQNTFANNPIEQNVNSIKTTLDKIEVPKLKNPKEAILALENVKKLTDQVKDLQQDADSLKRAFEEDFNSSKNELGEIDNWIRSDIQKAVNVAKLPDLDAQNIGTALFGESLLNDFNTYLEYLALAREHGSRFAGVEEEEEKIERYKGKNYVFSDKYDWPSFWIGNIELSGFTKTDIGISGRITNLTSDQKKIGEPVVIELKGEDANGVNLSIDGEIDYLGEQPMEKIRVAYSDFPLKNTKISPSELLKYDLKEGTGELSLDLNIIDKRISSEVGYTAKNIAFDFESAGAPKNRVESLIRTAISDANNINATALIDGTEGKLDVKVRSNIDDLFLDALKGTVSKQVEDAKRKIRSEVESQVTAKRREVETLVREKEAQIRKEYNALQAKVDEQLKLAEAKKAELEKKKKELEDAIKNKAKDALKKRIGF